MAFVCVTNYIKDGRAEESGICWHSSEQNLIKQDLLLKKYFIYFCFSRKGHRQFDTSLVPDWTWQHI